MSLPKTVHRPEAELMSAEDALADAQRLMELLETPHLRPGRPPRGGDA